MTCHLMMPFAHLPSGPPPRSSLVRLKPEPEPAAGTRCEIAPRTAARCGVIHESTSYILIVRIVVVVVTARGMNPFHTFARSFASVV